MQDHRLGVRVTAADGTAYRWGPDEPLAQDVFRGLSFTTSDPGGFRQAGLSLPRRIDQDFPDLSLFDDVVIYGAGGEIAWEGRVEEMPRKHGGDYSVQVDAVGWAAHLKDDPSFREIYVDRDLTRWGPMSAARRVALGTTNYVRAEPTVRFDYTSGVPLVELALERINSVSPGGPFENSEAWYHAEGLEIGSAYYDALPAVVFAAPWAIDLIGFPDDTGVGSVGSVSFLGGAGPFTGTFTPTGVCRALDLRFRYSGTFTGDSAAWWIQLRRPAVFGAHGLTKRGSAPNEGFFASDVIADIIRRAAPKLNFTTGAGGSVRESSFVIPHLVFVEPVSAEDAILAVNAYEQRTWGVEDGRSFFWRPTNEPRRRWRARLSEGTSMDLAGPQAENAINGVIVRFEGPDGVQQTAGPIGSGCKTESELLQDASPENVATLHGLKRWAILDLGFVTTGGTSGGAVQVGAAYLRESLSNMNVRGDVTIRGRVRDEAGVYWPAWAVRAGDSVTVEDADRVERRVVETSYEHDSRSLTASLDVASHKTEALMERMGVALVGRI